MLKLRQSGKAQTKTITPDWPARCAGEHTTEEEIYLSGKHNFIWCFHFSVKFWGQIRKIKQSETGFNFQQYRGHFYLIAETPSVLKTLSL